VKARPVGTIRLVVAPVVGIATFLGAWELLVRVRNIRPFVLTAPSRIVWFLGRNVGDFLGAARVTAFHAVTGLALALLLSIVIGAAMAAWQFLEHATQPILTMIMVTPFVAYIAPVVVWLDGGDPPAQFIITLWCIPAFTFAAVDGMRSADAAARELLASVDASRREVFWHLRLPSAVPQLFTACRYNVGLALIAAYLVEGGNLSNRGLGAIGRRAASLNDADNLWATVFTMVVLGSIALMLLALLQRYVLRWHVSQRRPGQQRLAADTVRIDG
jgi:NitT/TauT family transport system permease protein